MADVEDDSIRGALTQAFEQANAEPSPALEPAPEPQAAELQGDPPPVDRTRDEQGRFAKAEKPRETLTLKPQQGLAAPAPAQPAAPKAEEASAPPPIEWKGAAKVDWQRLPKNVQAAIRETYDSLQQAGADVLPVKELIDVNRQFYVNEAGSVAEAFRQMTQFAQMANTVDGTVQLVHHLLQRRGIDPGALFGGQPAQPGNQPQTPDLSSIIAQTVQREMQPFKAQIEQRENHQHINTIDTFAADPAHPYFNDVRQHMGALLKAGHAKDLQDAYDQATWANPVIRQQLLAAQAEDAAKVRAAEVEKAKAAQQASVTGAPTLGSVSQQAASDGTLRGDLIQAWNRSAA